MPHPSQRLPDLAGCFSPVHRHTSDTCTHERPPACPSQTGTPEVPLELDEAALIQLFGWVEQVRDGASTTPEEASNHIALLLCCQRSDDTDLRRDGTHAISGLASTGSAEIDAGLARELPGVLRGLATCMRDESSMVKGHAARAVRHLAGKQMPELAGQLAAHLPELAAGIAACLQNAHEGVRFTAAQAIAALAANQHPLVGAALARELPALYTILAENLSDDAPLVRRHTAWALRVMAGHRGLEMCAAFAQVVPNLLLSLVPRVIDADREAQLISVDAICTVLENAETGPAMFAQLRHLLSEADAWLHSDDTELQCHAAEILCAMAGSRLCTDMFNAPDQLHGVVDGLRKCLRADALDVQWQAARATIGLLRAWHAEVDARLTRRLPGIVVSLLVCLGSDAEATAMASEEALCALLHNDAALTSDGWQLILPQVWTAMGSTSQLLPSLFTALVHAQARAGAAPAAWPLDARMGVYTAQARASRSEDHAVLAAASVAARWIRGDDDMEAEYLAVHQATGGESSSSSGSQSAAAL